MYRPEIPVFEAVRQEDSADILWMEKFKEEHIELVVDIVIRIQAILRGESSGEAT
jgi:hypothetical protein